MNHEIPLWQKHNPIFFKSGDLVVLLQHREYNVPGITGNKNLAQQYAGPSKVLYRIGNLPYILELPPSMASMYPVTSVAHLESTQDPEKDPFQREFAQSML